MTTHLNSLAIISGAFLAAAGIGMARRTWDSSVKDLALGKMATKLSMMSAGTLAAFVAMTAVTRPQPEPGALVYVLWTAGTAIGVVGIGLGLYRLYRVKLSAIKGA